MFPNLIHIAEQGGVVVSILVGLSLIALTVILVKAWQFFRLRPLSAQQMQVLLASVPAGQRHEQAEPTFKRQDLASRLLAHMVALISRQSLSAADLRMESQRKARELLSELTDHLRILEVVANVAPLLGLFGTVLGMIEAFQAMEVAGSQVNPAVLSGGIWQALLTTAVGLAVAIPVSMAHSWFERRVEVQATLLQDVMDRTQLLQTGDVAEISLAVAA